MNNVLITGGASGLGEEILTVFSSKYDKVFFTYCNSIDNAKKIEKAFKNCKGFYCDFKNIESVNDFSVIINDLNINILINNALSYYSQKHFIKSDPDCFLNSFKYNIIPTITITQACIKSMKKTKFGRIINILSNYIENPPIGFSEYAANKHYLLSLSNSWAIENKKFNISSNCISPSFMLTGLTNSTDPRSIEMLKENASEKSFVSTKEVALMILHMSKQSMHLNRSNIILKD